MKSLLLKQVLFVILISGSLSHSLLAQNIHYQEIIQGGVTGSGYSVCLGTGIGTFNIFIPPNSKISKAFLYSYRIGKNSYDYTITLNGNDYMFGDYNRISRINYNNGIVNVPDFSVHCIDITTDIDSSVTLYSASFPSFTIPSINCNDCRYNSVFLLVLYENPALSKINASIIYNNHDNDTIVTYNVAGMNPVNAFEDVGLSIYSDRIGDILIPNGDGSYLILNSDTLGLLGGADTVNYMYNCGVKGSFYYQDSTLFGIDEDTPDSLMHRNDGLANIKGYLTENDNNISLSTEYKNKFNGSVFTDFFLTWHLAYTTPCDTFTAGISQDTLMDLGDSTHLSAYGGYKYKWQPSFGLRCDTCANTIAKPDSSTLYTCTIYNNDSCTKVLPVKVNIYNNVSIEPIGDEIKIILYPNPAENNITIKLSSNTELEYTVTSIQGQELKGGTLYSKETEIDVSELSPGFYFVIIYGDGFKKSLRFIKR